MNVLKEEYLSRLEALIRDTEDALEQLPDAPARNEMRRMMEEMERILEKWMI